MPDPVTAFGTAVGVASLAIQLTQILHDYCKGVSNFQYTVQGLFADTQQLSLVLKELEHLVKEDSLRLSRSFTTTSTLYVTNARCEARLRSLIAKLEKNSQASPARQLSRALRWPFKAQETRDIAAELHGYIRTFNFALSLDGCKLLLQTSGDVCKILQESLRSTSIAEENAKEIRQILSLVTSFSSPTLDIQQGVHKLVDEKFFEWLGARDMSGKHQIIRKKRSPDTGEWIFLDSQYKQWEDGLVPVLWAQGKPGAGKSVLISCVIDKLKADASRTEGIAYFYCDFSVEPAAQTAEVILASFIHQLILQLGFIPVEVNQTYQCHRRKCNRPDLSGYIRLLQQTSTAFSTVRLLIDALDELNPDCRDNLMEGLEASMEFTEILITSRPQSIDREELEKSTLRCTIAAQREDLTVFIECRLAAASRGLRANPGWNDFVRDTVGKLVTLADGMFILVSLQLDSLLRFHTIIEMRSALETISHKVDDFYAITLDRIEAEGSPTALKILAWLVTSPVPFTIRALQEALALEYSTTFINPDALVPIEDMVPMCHGLVILGEPNYEGDRDLSLAHATVQDYLSINLSLIRGFDRVIGDICVKYLYITESTLQASGLDEFESEHFPAEWENVHHKHPFLLYAANTLRHYGPRSGTPNEEQALLFSIDVRFAKIKKLLTELGLESLKSLLPTLYRHVITASLLHNHSYLF